MDIASYRERRRELCIAVRNANMLKDAAKYTPKEDPKWKKNRGRVLKHHRHIVMGMALIREQYYGSIRRERLKKIFKELEPLFEAFTKSKYEIYLVGGAVRDAVAGKPVKDYDFVVKASQQRIEGILAALNANIYMSREGTVHCIWGEKSVQISSMKGKDIDEDLNKRDFTVNAIALTPDYNFSSELSQTHYRQLTGKKPLRCVADANETFVSDPVRIMRMYRFAQALDVKIEDATRQAARDHAHLLRTQVKERVAAELKKILEGDKPWQALRMMMEDGVLHQVIPELAPQVGWDQQNARFPRPLWEHTLTIVKHAKSIGSSWRTVFAALLSQVGKPFFYQYAYDCPACSHRIFIEHTQTKPIECQACHARTTELKKDWILVGKSYAGLMQANCDLSHKILSRLAFSNEDVNFVTTLVSGYQFYNDMPDWDMVLARRFVHKLGQLHIPMINLMKATCFAQNESMAKAERLRELIRGIKDKDDLVSGKIPASGLEIAQAVGIQPGPKLKPVIAMVKQAVVDGVVKTKQQAIDFAKLAKKE